MLSQHGQAERIGKFMTTQDDRRARVRRLTNDVNERLAGFGAAGASDDVRQYRRRPRVRRALVTRYEGHLSPRIGVWV